MKKQKNVCIVVLGDIGRSPRMQYHALSLAEEGHKVDIVGYWGSDPLQSLKDQPLVSFHYLNPNPTFIKPKLLNYVFKAIWQVLNLLLVFAMMRKSDFMLVQNPPAIPTLFVCWIYTVVCRAKLIIDWHNYAHTIMALTSKETSLLVKFAKCVEIYCGRKADYNFCVTKAMKDDLKSSFGITATTLYDRPAEIFTEISLESKHELLTSLGTEYKELSGIITEKTENGIQLRENRPGVLISSTSWTEDEDFGILYSALQEYELHRKEGNLKQLPNLICIITGKGPLKQYYTSKMLAENWEFVKVITPWLTEEDYPKLLASADLGVCLHVSSSGLDLPMKVVDMFGCGLPVCAYEFNCLKELVRSNQNGFTFKTSEELSKQLLDWFDNFPRNDKQKSLNGKFKAEIKKFQNLRWRENWNLIAKPAFK